MSDSLANLLQNQAASRPAHETLVFLKPGRDPQTVTFEQLDQDARTCASLLQAHGARPGDIAILYLEHRYELVAAFWGALYCGVVPIIFPYPSSIPGAEQRRERLSHLAQFSRARLTVCLPHTLEETQAWLEKTTCSAVGLDLNASNKAGTFTPCATGGEHPAYIQFSSGTTDQPKGIVLSHRAVFANLAAIQQHMGIDSRDIGVGWLPLHHDMGLISTVLMPVFLGTQSISIAPGDWLRHPEMLFQAIHRYRGTYSAMPNFAFRYLLRSIRDEDMTGLDLSSWRIALNGSEPIQTGLMEEFAQRFERWGFNRQALIAAYGMAENVLEITSTHGGEFFKSDIISSKALHEQHLARPVEASDPHALKIACCGSVVPQTRLAIVDEDGQMLPERHLGEIVIAGDSLFSEYLANPERTQQVLRGGWFYTGDLGYLADGELYVCDRKKDLLILAGRNVFPESIEAIALEKLGTKGSKLAAFGVFDQTLGTETAVLVCETRPRLNEQEQANFSEIIRNAVRQKLDVDLTTIYFAPRGWIVYTTSGKIARAATRQKYLAEQPRQTNSRASLEGKSPQEKVYALWAEVLGRPPQSPDENFFKAGGDSLAALRLTLAIEEETGLRVDAGFIKDPRAGRLIAMLSENLPNPPAQAAPAAPAYRQSAGPTIRATLPYALGVRLQRMWVSNPVVQEGFFKKQIELLRNWTRTVGQIDEEETILRSLLANTWRGWRAEALQSAQTQDQWVEMHGLETLEQACQPKQGVIIGLVHSPGNHLITQVLQRHFPEQTRQAMLVGKISQSKRKKPKTPPNFSSERWRTRQVFQAHQTLKQGGWVLIALDGFQGSQPRIVPVYGRPRPFFSGAAQLAAETGSLLVPITTHFETDGHIRVEIAEPVRPSRDSEAIFNQYINWYLSEWPANLGNLYWGHLSKSWHGIERGLMDGKKTITSEIFE